MTINQWREEERVQRNRWRQAAGAVEHARETGNFADAYLAQQQATDARTKMLVAVDAIRELLTKERA